MSLHKHKAHFEPGAREYLTLILAGVIVFAWAAVVYKNAASTWEVATGTVQDAHPIAAASTTLAHTQLMHVEYTYTARGQTFRDTWEGDWPSAHTPNALHAADLNKLRTPDFPLLVWYDPENPGKNEIHRGGSEDAILWQRILAGVSIVLIYYIMHTYVRRKSRRHR